MMNFPISPLPWREWNGQARSAKATAAEIGMVGMAARASGLARDIRSSHPEGWFIRPNHQPVIKHHGDVFSRAQMRKAEITQSISIIKTALEKLPEPVLFRT